MYLTKLGMASQTLEILENSNNCVSASPACTVSGADNFVTRCRSFPVLLVRLPELTLSFKMQHNAQKKNTSTY